MQWTKDRRIPGASLLSASPPRRGSRGGGLSVRVGLRQREEQPYALTLRNL